MLRPLHRLHISTALRLSRNLRPLSTTPNLQKPYSYPSSEAKTQPTPQPCSLRFTLSADSFSTSSSPPEEPPTDAGSSNPPTTSPELLTVTPDDSDPLSYGGPEISADLTPQRIVSELDRHIVGQQPAKKALAIALRNRWRRLRLSQELREEVLPKCCLLIGSSGVGKTELARRLSKLVDSPFIKVEATKFTEVGFHGRDVEQIVRDLLENAITLARNRQRRVMASRIATTVEERILDELMGKASPGSNKNRDQFRHLLRQGALDHQVIDVDQPVRRTAPSLVQVDMAPERMTDVFDKLFTVRQSGSRKRRVKISDARALIEEAESEKLLSDEAVVKEAIEATENAGIVVIDEIDKIAVPVGQRHGADASSQGVQRDLLPLIEGTTVSTKHGNVETDHILFIAAGAFTQCKPSDLMAELVGRLPIRVELKPLSTGDLRKILTVPENNLIRQQRELMATEGVTLEFTQAAITEVANIAAEINHTVEDIGARRLHAVIERIVQDISFTAPELKGQTVTVDAVQVQDALGDLLVKSDLSRFIL
ncbi:ATP-dependent Hsl protease ATP-binding subunit HslU, heat shock protein HslU [Chondrus crispus]|uniref:ATP-dependent Hsl protease ATP-binding subunit HslU, heat shock protein HslU n=1 Tax=Chondrus crispus TaxID=2769 RepID=R7Q9Y2_CHOCR|nr:ATP-dependent Hsl protease ATP-binding subunit HslU, heat shock protein HslU [Chondrus crispus]CDF34280.1 ATP-dependent Hsl protease ATP-binding subunit HslU, heat shock protein HslU [Chondrus crispus]|eukprot:XP_005714099.1 ATP-dependent Hsl protease ATP-binding subunit HslU, heat shock protein HslU [Chondrus crispus]